MRGERVDMLLPGAQSIDLSRPLAHFAEHGYARLGPILSAEALQKLRERCDDFMLGRITYPGLFFQRDTDSGRYEELEFKKGFEGPSLNYRKIEKIENDPLFLALIENPLFERIARSLIEGDIVIYRAVIFNKPASGGTELPWHQDAGSYWGLSRDPFLQVWIALDDAPVESGCVFLLPKSHIEGLASPLGGLIQPAALAQQNAEQQGVHVPAQAGEALLIHNHVWHRSGTNTTGKARRAVTICYMGADVRCTRKKKKPRSFFPVFRGQITPYG